MLALLVLLLVVIGVADFVNGRCNSSWAALFAVVVARSCRLIADS